MSFGMERMFYTIPSNIFFSFFEKRSYYVAQAGLELAVLLSPPSTRITGVLPSHSTIFNEDETTQS
jgi:hypothetical protein